MAEVALTNVAVALAIGLVLAVLLGFILTRLAEGRSGQGLFKIFFLILLCVYALGFATRYVLIELLT
jgi:hypothetical protein